MARAAEDTLVYRIPAAAIRPVLERPAAVRFVARAMDKGVRLLAGHGERPEPTTGGRQVRELIRATPLVCSPDTSVQDGRPAAWWRRGSPARWWSSATASAS